MSKTKPKLEMYSGLQNRRLIYDENIITMEMGIKWVTTIYNSQAKTKSNRIKVHASGSSNI